MKIDFKLIREIDSLKDLKQISSILIGSNVYYKKEIAICKVAIKKTYLNNRYLKNRLLLKSVNKRIQQIKINLNIKRIHKQKRIYLENLNNEKEIINQIKQL